MMDSIADMMGRFARAADEFSSGGLNLQLIPEFTESEKRIPGVRSEYNIIGEKLVFHFWPDPQFPDRFDEVIERAMSGVQRSELLIEYVPELASWYTHVTGLPLGPSPALAERLIERIGIALGA